MRQINENPEPVLPKVWEQMIQDFDISYPDLREQTISAINSGKLILPPENEEECDTIGRFLDFFNGVYIDPRIAREAERVAALPKPPEGYSIRKPYSHYEAHPDIHIIDEADCLDQEDLAFLGTNFGGIMRLLNTQAGMEYEHPQPPKSNEALIESIREGRYYPFGLAPRQTNVMQHFFKTWDLFQTIRRMMAENGRTADAHIMIAGPPFNIEAALEDQIRKTGREPEAGECLEEAKRQARLIGLKDELLCLAIQEVIQSTVVDQKHAWGIPILHRVPIYRRVPIHQLADVVDTPEHNGLFTRIQKLFNEDEEFQNAAYTLVKKNFLPSNHRKKSYEKLMESTASERWKNMARIKVKYALFQTANVLFLNGEKMGHPDEEKYNKLALMAAKKLSIPKEKWPQFSTIKLPNSTGVNPYRTGSGEKNARRAESMTVTSSFADYLEASDPLNAIKMTARAIDEISIEVTFDLAQKLLSGEYDPNEFKALIERKERLIDELEKNVLAQQRELDERQQPILEDIKRKQEIIASIHSQMLRILDSRTDISATDKVILRDAIFEARRIEDEYMSAATATDRRLTPSRRYR